MSDLFLTEDELLQLTGYRKSAARARWLKKNGIRFTRQGLTGKVVVVRGWEEPPSPEPDPIEPPPPARPTFVYVMQLSIAGAPFAVKVGISRDVEKRLYQLRLEQQCRGDRALALVAQFQAVWADVIERQVHNHFAGRCVQGEWFDITPAEACAAVQRELRKRG